MSNEVGFKYLGLAKYTLDPKNRVTIPVSWRDESTANIALLRSSLDGYDVLKCYSHTWLSAFLEEKEKELISRGYDASAVARNVEVIASSCQTATLNSQGKVVIPKDALEHIGCSGAAGASNEQRTVKVVGYGRFFRIWRLADYEEYIAKSKAAEPNPILAQFDILN